MASVVSLRSQSQPLHNFTLSEPKWVTTAHRFRRHFESNHNHKENSFFSFTATSVSRGLNDTVSPVSCDPKKSPAALHVSSCSYSAENKNEKLTVLEVEKISTVSSDGKSKIILRFCTKNKSDDAKDPAPNLRKEPNVTSQSSLQKVVQDSSSKASEKKKRKFSIALTNQEIEEDFLAMTGKKPSRRPTKRPKKLQKELDALFPGLWLSSSITANGYRVRETPPN